MPDSAHYTQLVQSKAALSTAGLEGNLLWKIMDLSIDWLLTTSTKWSRLQRTGSNSTADFEQFGAVDINTWDPLGQEHPGGTHTNVAPNVGRLARSQYFRWESTPSSPEYGKEQYDFFWTTTKYLNVSGPLPEYSVYFNGVYSRPYQFVTSANIPHLTSPVPDYSTLTGWGPVPVGALPVGAGGYYPEWPDTGSHEEPAARTPANYPWSFDSQPGYTGETITNFLFFGTDDDFTIHCFAGDENGAPYFYVVIETRTTTSWKTFSYYQHIGFGVLNKLEDYYGGHFSAGNFCVGEETPSIAAEGRMFSAVSCFYDINGNSQPPSYRYALGSSGRSRILYSPDPPDTPFWFEREVNYTTFEFGTADTNTRAYSEIYPSFFPINNNNLTGKSILRPYTVSINDPRDGQNVFSVLIGTAPGIRGGAFNYCRDKAIWTDEDGVKWKLFAYRSLQNSAPDLYCSENLAIAYRIP